MPPVWRPPARRPPRWAASWPISTTSPAPRRPRSRHDLRPSISTVSIPEVALALDGQRRDRSAHIDVAVEPGSIAWADPGHLARALRNVVANALAHSPDGGVVAVTAGRAGPLVRIHVADQGPGIAADDVDHVFERFYRADTARATDPLTGRPTGLGLGLTIARELLMANGGRIAVERTGPNGTSFVVELPAAETGPAPRSFARTPRPRDRAAPGPAARAPRSAAAAPRR